MRAGMWCEWKWEKSTLNILHKIRERADWQKLLETTLSELWKLTKACSNLQETIVQEKKLLNCGKNTDLCDILTFPSPILSSPAQWQPWKITTHINVKSRSLAGTGGTEWGWGSFGISFPKNCHYFTCLVVHSKTLLARMSVFGGLVPLPVQKAYSMQVFKKITGKCSSL